MTTILLRTLIIYILLIGAMRLMGKRQIGQLEVSELAVTLILSEIAAMPIENQEIPVSYALIPIVTILTFEVVMSVIQMKFPKLKNLVSARPSTLIDKGEINQKELERVRLSADELLCKLRQKDVADIKEVNYAILEQSGQLTVIKKAEYKPPTMRDMALRAEDHGIMHILVDNGSVNKYNLEHQNKSYEWLMSKLDEQGCRLNEVFLFMIDDSGNTRCIKKDRYK
ncbi:MAG: DUF421 domain-containing protein [Eubacteriales bacterium]|jgi:uncharacterized membrane protein YcaP (DUF421 family)